MNIKKTLERHDNDYSMLEPFTSAAPISSSIVIPIYKHEDLLAKTLSNLSKHPEIHKTPELFEIIVVNDGSPGDVESVVKSLRFPCALKYHAFDKNRGASCARNKGASLASGDLLFFIDSDVLLPHNYFRESWKVHNAGKNVVVVGLAERVPPEDDRVQMLVDGTDAKPDITHDIRYRVDVENFAKSKYVRNAKPYDQKHRRIVEETDWFKNFGHQKEIWLWTLPHMVVTHNVSARRENVLKIHGFDERFKKCQFEDNHFGAKLIASGCFLVPLKTTGVFWMAHPVRYGGVDEKEREELWFKNWDLYDQLLEEDLPTPSSPFPQ